MADNEDTEAMPNHSEPLKETEDIGILMYKRGKEQEKLLAETVRREKETRKQLGKARERFQSAMAKVSHILPKRSALTEQIFHKEEKLKQLNERILKIDRFVDDCHLFLAKGNIYEQRVHETQDKINQAIVKERDNEQKLVVVYRRKDNLERLISRLSQKHDDAKARYTSKLVQHREAIAFQQEIRNNIKGSIDRAKAAYEKSIEIAPKILELQRKVRLLGASVHGIEFKINNKEDELKKMKRETELKRQEHEQLKLEQMARLDRKMRKLKFK